MDRLLSEQEIEDIENEYPREHGIAITAAKAQDLKTAAAVNAEWVAGIENIFGRCECVNDGQCTGCRHYKYGKCIYFLLQQLKQSMGVEE